MSKSQSQSRMLGWENAIAGAIAGFTTVAAMYPLDVLRPRFQVGGTFASNLPTYKNTVHAIFTIARLEGQRGLYAGFYPAVLGSSISWGLYFFLFEGIRGFYKGITLNLLKNVPRKRGFAERPVEIFPVE